MSSSSSLLRSRPGFIFIVVGLLLLALLGYALYSLQDDYLIYGPLALLAGWLLLTWVSLRVEVDSQHLEIRSLWGSRKMLWEEMASVRCALGSAGRVSPFQYLLGLRNFKSRRMVLILLPFHNREELLKEIINSSWRANPNVRLASSLTARYGFPPYARKRQAS